LSADQEAFRSVIRRFVKDRVIDGYVERAREGGYPWELHRAVADIGVLGIGLPSEFGGSGESDFVSLGIAAEELGYGDVSLGSIPAMVGLMGQVINLLGAREIQETWLPRLISGQSLIGIALTEPDAGSDAAALRMTAAKVDGGYVLSGEKTSISFMKYCEAVIVYAREPDTKGSAGISTFLVEVDRPGVKQGEFHDLGLNQIGRGWVTFDDVFVPDAALLGVKGKGFAQVMGAFDYSRVTIALQCLGAARASLEEVSEYVKHRQTFGKPLAAYQGVSLQIAEHHTLVNAATLKCYQTLWLRQQGRPHTADAAMCKWWGPRVAVDALESAMTLTGHVAWSVESPLQQRMRDVMAFLIADGTAEIQKLIIARSVIGREVLDR
jgi:cyclohexanecarboxyl-CoA dehydrogenase